MSDINGVNTHEKNGRENCNQLILNEFRKLVTEGIKATLRIDTNGFLFLSTENEKSESSPKDQNPWGDWNKNPWVKGEKFNHSFEHQEILKREFKNTLDNLENVDFSNYKKVLMRVNRFVVYGWSTYTKGIMDARKKEKIIRLFEEHQYLASDAGKKGNPNDAEYVAKWIICNLVDGLKNHQCVAHQAIEVQIEKWRRNFGDESDIL